MTRACRGWPNSSGVRADPCTRRDTAAVTRPGPACRADTRELTSHRGSRGQHYQALCGRGGVQRPLTVTRLGAQVPASFYKAR